MTFLRSWRDARRFKRLPRDERNLVIYSESRQDWHHFEPILRKLTETHGRTVCYVSSDPGDPGLETGNPRVRPFHIADGLACIVFFQMLDADVMLMTMMDLQRCHLKRSVNPVHYVYLMHSLSSTHMVDHADSYDAYDTILCAGPHQMREIRRREESAGLPAKELIPHGYGRLEALIELADAHTGTAAPGDPATVLVAPTWGENSLLNVCGEDLVARLLEAGYRTILRPHYQTLKLTPDVVKRITNRFGGHPCFEFVTAMGESESLLRSDLLVCDWSAMAVEYALGLSKPVLFVDVPPRVRNPDWAELGIEPLEVAIRSQVGKVLAPDRLDQLADEVEALLQSRGELLERMTGLRSNWVYNLGRSAEVAAAEIARIAEAAKERRAGRSAVQTGP